MWTDVDRRAVDTARVLTSDAAPRVGNGHPGTATSLAPPAAYTLFQKVMRHYPVAAAPALLSPTANAGHRSAVVLASSRKEKPVRLRSRGLLTASAALAVLSIGVPVPAAAAAPTRGNVRESDRPAARRSAHPQAHGRLLLLHRDRPRLRPHRPAPRHHAAGAVGRPRDDDLDQARQRGHGGHIWAPEIHFIDGKWYVYFAAAPAEDPWAIRPYVLESGSADPLTGAWTEKGRISLPLNTFSPEATTFMHNGIRCLSWAQADPAVGDGTGIHIARMSNPWTISGRPSRMASPTHAWETKGHRVNEGPAFISQGDKVFMTFSASATDSNYCLGLLTADRTSDLLNPASWSKKPTPVFTSNAATSQYVQPVNSALDRADATYATA